MNKKFVQCLPHALFYFLHQHVEDNSNVKPVLILVIRHGAPRIVEYKSLVLVVNYRDEHTHKWKKDRKKFFFFFDKIEGRLNKAHVIHVYRKARPFDSISNSCGWNCDQFSF